MSSFCWGILVFHEGVKSKFHALLASIILILGLIGMSVYSAPVNEKSSSTSKQRLVTSPIFINENIEETVGLINKNDRSNVEEIKGNASIVPIEISVSELNNSVYEDSNTVPQDVNNLSVNETNVVEDNNGVVDIEMIPFTKTLSSASTRSGGISSDQDFHDSPTSAANPTPIDRSTSRPTEFSGGKIIKRRKNNPEDKTKSSGDEGKLRKSKTDVGTKEEELVHFCGRFSLTKRQLGLVGAVINGAWGSNSMIPMHYAR